MTDAQPTDVFLSHDREDEAFVAALARRLKEVGLSYWFGPDHLVPGEDMQDQMDRALGRSRTCAVFIGAGGLSGWQGQQMRAAIQARVEDEPGYRVIPVLLPGAERPKRSELPRFLRLLEPVEFQSAGDERAFKYLLSGILGKPPIEVEDLLAAGGEAGWSLVPDAAAGTGTDAGEPAGAVQEGGGAPFDRLHVDPDGPPIRVIRQLLLKAFDPPETLRRFCQERPDFRELLNRFGPKYSLDDMVDEVITYSGTYLLWDDLLREVAVFNAAQYEHIEPELRRESGVSVAEPGAIPRQPAAEARDVVPRGTRDTRPRDRRPWPSAPPTGPIRNRWALLVGVNRYVDETFPQLKYCVNDVLALDRVLQAQGYTTIVLHDELDYEDPRFPTRENVEAELARLCHVAQPDDLLWAHFACHGKLVGDQALLVTYETRAPTLLRRALPLAEVEEQMRASGARRLVLTLDACHTGVEMGRDIADADFIKHAHDLAEGFALIAASTAQQVAQEWDEKQHGAFTYYLLEGLSGGADRKKQRFVTVNDLATHVVDGMRRFYVQHGGLLQEPTTRTEMIGDMILADYRKVEG